MIAFTHLCSLARVGVRQVREGTSARKRPVYGKIKDTPPVAGQAIDMACPPTGAFGRRACRAKTKRQHFQSCFRHRVEIAHEGRRS
jgi:hypothetical protein